MVHLAPVSFVAMSLLTLVAAAPTANSTSSVVAARDTDPDVSCDIFGPNDRAKVSSLSKFPYHPPNPPDG